MSLPVTLIAGPSTSLRDDLVRCLILRRPTLVAVSYEVEPTHDGLRLVRRVVDAGGTHQHEQLELTGCCLSCTVLQDAASALALVAGAERWQEAVLALPPSLRPGLVARALRGHDDVHVDTITTVVDALLVRELLSGDDLLVDRALAAAPTDRRSTAELVITQLEDADVLAVADLHRVAAPAARTLEALLAHLSPLALQVSLGAGGVGSDDVVSTGRHDATATPDDRERLASLAAGLCPPACGVTTVRWRSAQPLHSARLHAALESLVAGVVRSRGHLWLADRPHQRVAWESAGATLALGDPEPWQELPGSELVLTGVDLDGEALRTRLDACLATAGDLTGEATWEDPFEAALGSVPRATPR